MTARKSGLILLVVLLLPVFAGFNRGRAPEETTCLECHDDMKQVMEKKYLHYPFAGEQCEACHDPETFTLEAKGAALCTVCHRDFALEEGAKSIHPVIEDCTTCHDPHGSRNRTILLDSPPGLCLLCHEGPPIEERPASLHAPFEMGECTTCHSPHSSFARSLLLEEPGVLCADCHDVTDAAFKETHLNLLPEAADCLSCHNGHMSTNPKLVLENAHLPFSEGMCDSCHAPSEEPGKVELVAFGSQLCTVCHFEVEEQIRSKYPHLPATEDCLNCHGPHATLNESLLKRTGVGLCEQCHAEALTPSEGAKLHSPFAAGECMNCHSPHGSANAAVLANPEADVCLECHSATGQQMEDKHAHTAALQGCVACHNPHMGRRAAFLKEEGEALCFRCHESRPQQIYRFVHFPYKEGNCLTCHAPHAGIGAGNLAREAQEVCTMCHASRHKLFPHPVAATPSPQFDLKPDNKLRFSRDDVLVCATCHVPHATDTVFLLRLGVSDGELCYECHQR